jgi:hypothetical protein
VALCVEVISEEKLPNNPTAQTLKERNELSKRTASMTRDNCRSELTVIGVVLVQEP